MSPRAYLIIPDTSSLHSLPDEILKLQNNHDLACILVKGKSPDDLTQAINIIRPLCHKNNIAILVEDQIELAQRLQIDGVHITTGATDVTRARDALGPDLSIGSDAGLSRHKAMLLGEAGADYVAFSSGSPEKIDDMCAWWSPLFELPCVAFYPESEKEIKHKSQCDFYALRVTG